MLAIRVEYLTGVCFATRHDDASRSTPEWPPHPDRLFSALVAAAAEPGDDGDCYASTQIPEPERKALAWLADQGPPELSVSEARARSTPDVFMPTNPHEDEVWQKRLKEAKPKQGGGHTTTGSTPARWQPKKNFDLLTLLPIHRKKAGLPIPAVVPDDPAAYFIWNKAEPTEQLAALQRVCSRVAYLGRSRSLVDVSVVDDASCVPRASHVPDRLGQVQLRVPGTNRLEYLADHYLRGGRGGKPEPSPPWRYRDVESTDEATNPLRTVFNRIWVLRPAKGDPVLPAESTVKVTRLLRAALIRCVEDSGRAVPDIVHGHGAHPHCAFVTLPFVHPSQRHADGSIKGVAVVVPRLAIEADLEALSVGLSRLQHNGLEIAGVGTWRLEEVPADDPPMSTLDLRTWTGPREGARVWTTATPMVFGRFPKPKNGGEPGAILESLRMISASESDCLADHVLEIAVDRHSPQHGSPPSWCFKSARDRGGKAPADVPARHIRHVTLRFDRHVRGPLLLGCMRYFGLGLMRSLEAGDA